MNSACPCISLRSLLWKVEKFSFSRLPLMLTSPQNVPNAKIWRTAQNCAIFSCTIFLLKVLYFIFCPTWGCTVVGLWGTTACELAGKKAGKVCTWKWHRRHGLLHHRHHWHHHRHHRHGHYLYQWRHIHCTCHHCDRHQHHPLIHWHHDITKSHPSTHIEGFDRRVRNCDSLWRRLWVHLGTTLNLDLVEEL